MHGREREGAFSSRSEVAIEGGGPSGCIESATVPNLVHSDGQLWTSTVHREELNLANNHAVRWWVLDSARSSLNFLSLSPHCESGCITSPSGLKLLYSCEGYLYMCSCVYSCVHRIYVCASRSQRRNLDIALQAFVHVCLFIHLFIFKAGFLPNVDSPS